MWHLLLFAMHVAANAWYDSMPVIFWGRLAANKQSASVVVPIKGCLKNTTQVTIQGAGSCVGNYNQDVLIGGTLNSGNPAQSIVLTITNCTNIWSNASNQDRVFYAAQTDQNCKPQQCADGSAPLTCNNKQVCPPKAQWPQACSSATKCIMNACGSCAPIFLNNAGSQVCTTCPNFANTSLCKGNPCDSFPKTSLQCPQASSAAFCLPVTCGGCKAQWYDMYGRAVCSSPPCSTTGANLGKGQASLGFALVNGQCKAVKGKKSPIALFKDVNQCTANCICVDNGFVNFGNCTQALGFTLINGVCQAVQGCSDQKSPLRTSFFDTQAACSSACPNRTVSSQTSGASQQASGASRAAGASTVVSTSTTSTTASTSSSSSTRCPPGVTAQNCSNPCLSAPPPLCAEARGKNVMCVADYCGNCSARWILNNQPFSCPATQSCTGNGPNCCANSGFAPRDCSAFPCDIKACNGAATCSVDTCRQCAPTFKDAQGNQIPPSLCRGNANPVAFLRCAPGDPTCCKSGFRPLACNTPADLLNSTCASLNCGKILARDRTCIADPCDSCSLQVLNSKNLSITDQCQMAPPSNVCPTVQCPSDMTPNCTARPTQCGDLNLMCIKDECACQWRWFSVDMRPPSADCAAALQVCYSGIQCPNNYTCQAIPANLADRYPPAIAKQLICTQETCSCRPVLAPPVYGLRQPCSAGDPNCCPDGLQRAQCPIQQAQWSCSRLQCDSNYTAAQCRPDGCNQCQLDVLDRSGNIIPQGKCRLKLDTEMASVCAKVVCPNTTAACSARPSCFPNNWALSCIHDPCSCRSLWVDQDLRDNISPQCSKQIDTPCLTPQECPKNFSCNDINNVTAAQLDPRIASSLVCVQEPCTCRPVSTSPNMLPPGFRLPCNGGQCCADGQGPLVCPADLAALACATVQCNGTNITSCAPDGCNNCAIKVTGPGGSSIAPNRCRLPLNESAICPGTVCPPRNNAPDCGPRPSACPSDWTLRCIRDPCVCTRSIWVDEDLRIADPNCTAAIEPACATTCPTNFSCPGLVPPLRCIQERCTCRPIIDPTSIPAMMIVQQGPGQMQMGGPQGQMGGPQGQMGGPQGQMGGPQMGQMGSQQNQMAGKASRTQTTTTQTSTQTTTQGRSG